MAGPKTEDRACQLLDPLERTEMVSEAAKELFALANFCCGSLFLLVLLVYTFMARERRAAVILTLLLAVFLCILNSLTIYFLL